jgi:hypothetical protein
VIFDSGFADLNNVTMDKTREPCFSAGNLYHQFLANQLLKTKLDQVRYL